MNRQEYRQLGGLSRVMAVVQRRWRELSRSVAGSVETWRAVAVGIRGGTQNPALFEHTSSNLVPGISPPRLVLGRVARRRTRAAAKPRTDKETDRSRRIAQVLYLNQAERDRELRAINIALRSGTAAKVFG